MKIYFPIFFLILATSCNTKNPRKAIIDFPEGGYDYPLNVQDTNFFFYPLRDTFSKRDSFLFAYYGKLEMNAFQEPNLSLRPASSPVFRLDYSAGALSSVKPIMILLRENEIIVKEGISGFIEPEYNTLRLTEKEKFHFELLEWNYPLNDSKYKSHRKKYFDSLIAESPELIDPRYYMLLKNKSAVPKEPFKFKTSKISLSPDDYEYLVKLLNSSGFWEMNYDVKCRNMPADGGGFVLEANTPRKYNLVRATDCPGDTSSFRKACQEIVKYAKMQNKIQLVWRE